MVSTRQHQRNQTDPRRLEVAAHELGHFIAYQDAGLTVLDVRVLDQGDRAHGYVRLHTAGAVNAEQARGYLAGLLAGRVAAIRWCQTHGVQFHESACRTDRTEYRRSRTHPWVRDIPDAEFRATALGLVRTHWAEITRLAPRLARYGCLPV